MLDVPMVEIDIIQTISGLVVVRNYVGRSDLILSVHLKDYNFRITSYVETIAANAILIHVLQTFNESLVFGLIVGDVVPEIFAPRGNLKVVSAIVIHGVEHPATSRGAMRVAPRCTIEIEDNSVVVGHDPCFACSIPIRARSKKIAKGILSPRKKPSLHLYFALQLNLTCTLHNRGNG